MTKHEASFRGPFRADQRLRSERGFFLYAPGACDLHLMWRRPTDFEVDAISRAPLRVGVTVVNDCVFLLYAWRNAMYGDAPLVAAERSDEERRQKLQGHEIGLRLTVHLVDAHTRQERIRRRVVIGAPVSRLLRSAAQEYQPTRFSRHVRMVNQVYRQFSLDRLFETGTWTDTAWTLRRMQSTSRHSRS